MIGRFTKKEQREGFWTSLESIRVDDEGWRNVVKAAGWAADELAAPTKERRALDAAIARARPRFTREEWVTLAIEDRLTDYANGALDDAVLVGFALARTGEDWPRLALEAAGVPVVSDAPAAVAAATALAPISLDVQDRLLDCVRQDYVGTVEHERCQDRVLALLARLPEELHDEVDDTFTAEAADAERYAILLAYALGRMGDVLPSDYEQPTPPGLLARARALAGLDALPRRTFTTPPTHDAGAISAWLATNALADAPPAEVIARLLADRDALERLRPTAA